MNFKETFDKIISEEEIGEFYRINDTWKFAVESREGPTPHIHFFNGEGPKKSKISGCYKIFENDYFDHGKYHGRMPSDIKKIFLNIMANKEAFIYVANEWNVANNYKKVGETINPFNGEKINIPNPTALEKPSILN